MKALLILASAIVASALGTLLLIGKRSPLQSASGGCFINLGDGCNTYITQTFTTTDGTTSALLVGALIVVIVLGGAFLLLTRPGRGQ